MHDTFSSIFIEFPALNLCNYAPIGGHTGALDINDLAESVLGLLSPTAGDPLRVPCRIKGSNPSQWDFMLLIFAFALVINPVN
jgi:hypothetical protein